jgi:two-component system response regulator RegX3
VYIGILEDDPAQQALYEHWFKTAKYQYRCFDAAQALIDALPNERFDLLLIDWMLPESSGEEVLRWVREHLGWDIPVIFITARDNELDIVAALRSGADDYLVKPAKHLELLARIESLSRRSRVAPVVQLGAYTIDQEARAIELHGEAIRLTQKEFELACYMLQNPGKLLSRVHLLEKLWGLNAEVDTRTVDTHVSRIRRKLVIKPDNGWQIVPEYGYGYRMERIETTDGT